MTKSNTDATATTDTEADQAATASPTAEIDKQDTHHLFCAALNGFERDILQVLAYFTVTGIADPGVRGVRIKDELEGERRGYEEVSDSRLYQNLNNLVDEDLVEKRHRTVDDRSNGYVLTESGITALYAHLERLERDLGAWSDSTTPL